MTDTPDRAARIDTMLRVKHFGSLPYPRLMTASAALAAANAYPDAGIDFYLIYWWGNYPAGFTHFEWNTSTTADPLAIRHENRQQTALDQLATLDPDELVLVRGLDLPAAENAVWVLHDTPLPTDPQ